MVMVMTILMVIVVVMMILMVVVMLIVVVIIARASVGGYGLIPPAAGAASLDLWDRVIGRTGSRGDCAA